MSFMFVDLPAIGAGPKNRENYNCIRKVNEFIKHMQVFIQILIGYITP